MLRDIIQRGEGSLFDFIQRYVLLGVNSTREKREEAQRYIDRLVERGDLNKTEAKTLMKEIMEAPEANQDDFEDMIAAKIANDFTKPAAIYRDFSVPRGQTRYYRTNPNN